MINLSRILRIILIILLFVAFFEIGLISSYTIVTGRPPDVGKLIDSQINEIVSLLHIGSSSGPSQEQLKVTNKEELAEALKNETGLGGIDLQSISVVTSDDTDKDIILVNITAMGYKDAQTGGGTSNVTSGPIVIRTNETYSITATAMARTNEGSVTVEVITLKILSLKKLFTNQI